MTALSSQVRQAGSVIGALDAISNYRALAIEVAGQIAGTLVLALCAAISGSAASFAVGMLLATLIGVVTWNAAGVVLMDQVLGSSPRPVADALIAGAFASIKGVVALIAAILAVIGVVLVIALLLYVCKVPGVGPVLFFLVFPVATIAMGMVLAALFLLFFPVAAPAIWAGESIGGALARVAVVAKRRLVGVVIRNIALGIVILIAGAILWGVLLIGVSATGGLSTGILNVGASLPSPDQILGGGFGSRRGGDGYVTAALSGGMLLLVVVLTLPFLMLQKGWCLIYADTVADLDVSAIEAGMQQRMAQVKQKADAARDRVQQHNLAARAAATVAAQSRGVEMPGKQVAHVSAATASPSGRTCPSCHAAIPAGDAFCGECGFRLT